MPTKNPFKIDHIILFVHAFVLALSYFAYTFYPYKPPEHDLSGLFVIIFIILSGVISLTPVTIGLRKIDKTIPNLKFKKFLLFVIYWISSCLIFFFSETSQIFGESPYSFFLLFLILFSSIYFSIIHISNLQKKDWLMLAGFLLGLFILFFSPLI